MSVLDYVLPQVFPLVVEDHPPVRTEQDPAGGGGDVHHEVDSRQSSAHNEDCLLEELLLGGMSVLTAVALEASKPGGNEIKIPRAIFPPARTDCAPMSGIRG